MKRWIAGACFFVSLVLPVAVFAADVRMEVNTFLPALDFGIRNTAAEKAQRFDIKAGLGVEDTAAFESRVYLGEHVRLSYVDLQYAGKRKLLENEWLPLALDSDFRLEYGGVAFSAPLTGGEKWRLEGQFDVKGYRFGGSAAATLRSDALAAQEARAWGIAPTVGLAVSADPTEHFHLYGEASVLPLGTLGSLWDFDAGVKYRVKDRTFLHVGYRHIAVESVEPAFHTALDARIGGPYFGLNYDF